MRRLIQGLSIATLALSLATVGSVFYEGVTLTWYDHVAWLLNITDVAFYLATFVGLWYYRKQKTIFWAHLLSLALIVVSIVVSVMTALNLVPDFVGHRQRSQTTSESNANAVRNACSGRSHGFLVSQQHLDVMCHTTSLSTHAASARRWCGRWLLSAFWPVLCRRVR